MRRLITLNVACVLLLATGSLLAVLMVPGEIISPTEGNFGGAYEAVYEHGWPLVWGYRSYIHDFDQPDRAFPDIPLWGVPWLAWDSWAVWQADRWKMRWAALAADTAVAIVAVALGGWLCRRIASQPLRFRFRLRGLLLAMLLVSLPAAWWFSWTRGYAIERDAENRLYEINDGYCLLDYAGPLSLKRLLGENLAGLTFHRVREASLDLGPDVDFAECVRLLSRFDRLESLELNHSRGSRANYDRLAALPRLRLLTIRKKINGSHVRELARLTGLEEVCLQPWEVQDPAVVTRLIGAMPNTRVVGEDLRTWLGREIDTWSEAFWAPDG